MKSISYTRQLDIYGLVRYNAAVMASQKGTNLREVDITALQEQLKKDGAILD